MSSNLNSVTLGLDLGTSGLRAALVKQNQLLAEFSVAMPMPERDGQKSQQSPQKWRQAFEQLMDQIAQANQTPQIDRIIADATSSTLLIADQEGRALSLALMYDDKRAQAEAEQIRQTAPQDSAAQGANSSLAKVLWLIKNTPKLKLSEVRIQHQIDWLNQQLIGQPCATDENNLLKLGYDSLQQTWPNWVKTICPVALPTAVSPGSWLGQVSHELQTRWNFKPHCQVYAGTTDSIAAFLASGAQRVGDAVSALGSTLAIKLLSDQPIFSAKYGIYSHKLGNQWLVGGASNTGGAVLLHYFTLEQLVSLIPQLDLTHPTLLPCYPLIRPGERFPIADPNLAPIIPETDDPKRKLQALIEGLVDVEKTAYQKLAELGAPKVKRLFAVGGGNRNQAWSELRKMHLSAKITKPISQSAAYGVTRLITG